GEAVPVDAVIAVLGEPGEDYQSLLDGNEKAAPQKEEATTTEASAEPNDDTAEAVTPESLGATVITMPLLSDTMTEGVIAEWHFKVGDKIKSDDVIADVETDKA